MANQKCGICNNQIYGWGHNAEPVSKMKRSDGSNNYVITVRINDYLIKKQKKHAYEI